MAGARRSSEAILRPEEGKGAGMAALAEGLVVRVPGHHVGAAIRPADRFPLLRLGLALGKEPAVGFGHLVIN